jgi:protein-disulfide isomerase
MVNQLAEELGQDIKIAFRHYPLSQLHKNAELAARAAEAAAKQDKFWEMHDLLFKLQDEWAEERNVEDKFTEYAQSLELDLEQFTTDLDSKQVKDKVTSDYQSGLKLGVNSTPTFFLNGQRLQNPQTYDEFKNLIQSSIEQSQQNE